MFRTLASSVNHFNKQSQFELFPLNGSGNRPADPPKARFFLKSLTVSLESLVVIGIVVMMSLVVSYSMGVEKGKTHLRAAVTRAPKKVTVPATSVPPQTVVNPTVKGKTLKLSEPKLAVSTPAPVPAAAESAAIASARQSEPLILEKPQEAAVILANEIEKFYTIQVASYKSVKIAQKEADSLKKKGYDILVLSKGNFSIVCVGKFNQKEQAKTFSQKLKKQYKDCLVRSL